MKYIFIVLITIFSFNIYAFANPYQFKSMRIEYSAQSISSNLVMQGSEISAYDDYGNKSYVKTIETNRYISNTDTIFDKSKTVTILKDNWLYYANLLDSIGTKQEIKDIEDIGMNYGMAMSPNYLQKDKSDEQIMKDFVIENGGKWLGQKEFLNRKCWVYELNGFKQWIYKRVILKIESIDIENRYEKKAIDIQENIDIPDSLFDLPKGVQFKLIKSDDSENN